MLIFAGDWKYCHIFRYSLWTFFSILLLLLVDFVPFLPCIFHLLCFWECCFSLHFLSVIPQNNSIYSHSFNMTFSLPHISSWLLSFIKMLHKSLPNFLFAAFPQPFSFFIPISFNFFCSSTSYCLYSFIFILSLPRFFFSSTNLKSVSPSFPYAGYLSKTRQTEM